MEYYKWTQGVGGLGMLTRDVHETRWQKTLAKIGRYITLWSPLLATIATLPVIVAVQTV